MKFTRRDFLHGVSTVALVAGLPSDKVEARLLRGGSGGLITPTGKNQIGLVGPATFNMQHPFANWWVGSNITTLAVTAAGAITGITASQPTSTVTISIGTPCLMTGTFAATLPPDNASFVLTTTGALPTGLTAGNTYYVKSTNYVPGQPFQISATPGGAAINTSGTQSGTHTATSQWIALATTSGPHGLYQTGANAFTNHVGPRNTFWPLTVSGASPSGYNHASTSSNYDFVIVSANTFSYQLASNPDAFTGTATLSYTLTDNSRPNDGGSCWGLDSNANLFFDSDRNPVANIPLGTSVTMSRVMQIMDLSHGAVIPTNGITPYSRSSSFPGQPTAADNLAAGWNGPPYNAAAGAGQVLMKASTPLGSSTPTIVAATWQASQDGGTTTASFTWTNMAAPPRDIYYGLAANYQSWLAAVAAGGASPATGSKSFFEPAFVNQLKAGAGKLRFMDWQATNAWGIQSYSQMPPVTYNYWGNQPVTQPPFAFGMPVGVMTSLANETNKPPWINIPSTIGCKCSYAVTVSNSNPAVIGTLWKHNFVPGDIITPHGITTGTGGATDHIIAFGFGQTVNATTTVSTSTFGGTQNWVAGQPVTSHTTINGIQIYETYFVCNPMGTTFQLSKSRADALANTPITLTGSNSSATIIAGLNALPFVVGAVTDYSYELSNVNSTDFGTPPSLYAAGDPVIPQNYIFGVSTLVDLTKQATEVTLLANAVKSQLNSNLIPNWQYGNELWNNKFPANAWLNSQSNCFVNPATGVKYFFGNDVSNYGGYLYANVMNAVRNVFGGGAAGTRKWEGKLGVATSNTGDTTANLNGITTWLTLTSSALTIPDLVDDLALTCYYNVGSGQNNGTFWAGQNVSISAASPSLITLANGGTVGTNSIWPGQPISFNTFGTLPTDAATGQQLKLGSGSTTVAFRGQIVGNILTISHTVGPPAFDVLDLGNGIANAVTAGMTVFGQMNSSATAGIFQSGVKDTVIAPFGTGTDPATGLPPTGTGGLGTYLVVGPSQNIGPLSLLGYDVTTNNHVYYALGTSNNFQYSSSLNLFTGSVSGTALTVTSTFQGSPAVGDVVWVALNAQSGVPGSGVQGIPAIGANNPIPGITLGTTILSGTYPNFVLSASFNIASCTMGSGAPVSCTPGTGSTAQNAVFVGSITAGTLNVTSVTSGTIAIGQYFGSGIGNNGTVTITGGSGTTWTLSKSTFTVAAGTTMTSGFHFAGSGVATLFLKWMSDSFALGPAPIGNGTNPSQYTEFNKQLNYEMVNGPRTAFRIIGSPQAWGGHAHILDTNGLIPSVGICFYEGSWGNDLQGVDSFGYAKTSNAAFSEFWPQAIGTLEDANNWTQTVAQLALLPGFVDVRAGYTVPANLRVGFPAQFVDSGVPTTLFAYGAVYYCDHYVGLGAPNWQNNASPGAKWNAILASN